MSEKVNNLASYTQIFENFSSGISVPFDTCNHERIGSEIDQF